MTPRDRFLAALLAAALVACGDDPPVTPDAGTHDSGAPDGGLPDGTFALPGLDGPVEVVVDTRGMPHIYGSTRHDVIMVQAYLMARDRYGQMEFIRRDVLGRISEFAGPAQIERDLDNRFVGYGYWGRQSYETLAADDPSRLAAEAFVQGVNTYIAQIRSGEVDPVVQGANVLALIIGSPFYDDWHPGDVFAMARYQAANLSYSPGDDVNRTRRIAGVLSAFPADSADPRLAARSGLYADWFTDRPARAVFTREGFNDGTTPAILPVGLPSGRDAFTPSLESLAGAERFLDRLDRWRTQMWGDAPSIGSNNWAVHGDHTASGNPILANDPHLALYSPPIWWYGHLDTTRMGATGDEAINVQGVTFGGLPGVIIGYNEHIAWGPTTTGYDVSDVYQEELTGTCDAEGNVLTGTVLFEGAQVAIEHRDEVVNVAGATEAMTFRLPLVPHHGMFVPGSCAAVEGTTDRFTALSYRYTGWQTYDDLQFIADLWTASTVEEARDALDGFRVGSQNWMVVDENDIFWTTQSDVPVREGARTFAVDENGIPSGICPNQVLPGTGGYEWTGLLDETLIPHDQNPARGWIATANQDNVGVTEDGNPCNDAHYIGGDFAYGWREFRIQERLGELVTRGDVTVEDMIDLQAETQFQVARTSAGALAAALESPLVAVPTLTSAEVARLDDVRARLEAWESFESPHGVGATSAGEIADSVAMTLFTVSMTRIIPLALDDEATRIGNRGGSNELVRLFEWMLSSPESLETYDTVLMDTVLWDDLDTVEIETRKQIVIAGVLATLTYLDERLGTDMDAWRWGRLHTVTFETLVPILGGDDVLSIPAENDPMYPDGFPRHGGFNTVDPGNHGVWDTTDFSHGSGASQRMVVEMTPDGPRAFNAIPGGQDIDPNSAHHDDEAMFWIRNESPPMYWTQADIEAHVEERLSFVDAD